MGASVGVQDTDFLEKPPLPSLPAVALEQRGEPLLCQGPLPLVDHGVVYVQEHVYLVRQEGAQVQHHCIANGASALSFSGRTQVTVSYGQACSSPWLCLSS